MKSITDVDEQSSKNYTLPLVLKLNRLGGAKEWISYEKSAYYYAKGLVSWALGEHTIDLRGGINAKSGQQSILRMNTIIAVNDGVSPNKYRRMNPTLTNDTLFRRDMRLCAYCGGKFKLSHLTRDHVHPVSRGGKDTWENCVTACYVCNQWKADRTPEEAQMQLRYVPYTPTFNEHLILANRKILKDQMEYLLNGVSTHSRIREVIKH